MSAGAVILFQDLPTSSISGIFTPEILLKLATDTLGIFSYPDPPSVTVIELTVPPTETVAKPVATFISCVLIIYIWPGMPSISVLLS